ncbi:hypothetical protein N8I71_09250 [Roseibacterium sp. SDUM158016]|uniref:hypothetical protein n=1 Tax=Roseicyclus sediminis TaxID=2980997 RepID=UPI0021CE0F4E|nr:hypothetical protein [Roseibacterium sp. SDUM158016]MCU4653017.1 hypothetical protein [Roseibacterium sp. SDUM158016]
MVDMNGDGLLDAGEQVSFDGARAGDMELGCGQGQGAMRGATGELALAFGDADLDGKIILDGSLAQAVASIACLDRDGGGGVSSAALGPMRG